MGSDSLVKRIHIIAGGTFVHVAPHFALAAPAYGTVGDALAVRAKCLMPTMDTVLHKTKMAGGRVVTLGEGLQATAWDAPETNTDVEQLLDRLVADLHTKVVILAAAICDWEMPNAAGKHGKRWSTTKLVDLALRPTPKLLPLIRHKRKDIFAVGFSATTGANLDEQYEKAIRVLKTSSVNLVLANDIHTGANMVVTPEESTYFVGDRDHALDGLMRMVADRSHLTFTQSRVVEGDPVRWTDLLIPANLRKVVEHCIERGAYKPVMGRTAGHFAVKLDDTTFLTSRRKTNFRNLPTDGLVRVKTDGPDTVMAYGSKPSVGGQSQRIVFRDHPGYDCIVHFHCPRRDHSLVPVVSQREFECGSHECGKNTSDHLQLFNRSASLWEPQRYDIKAVYLDRHGPNIIFKHDTPAEVVIQFIEENFDLTQKTGPQVWDKK